MQEKQSHIGDLKKQGQMMGKKKNKHKRQLEQIQVKHICTTANGHVQEMFTDIAISIKISCVWIFSAYQLLSARYLISLSDLQSEVTVGKLRKSAISKWAKFSCTEITYGLSSRNFHVVNFLFYCNTIVASLGVTLCPLAVVNNAIYRSFGNRRHSMHMLIYSKGIH